LSKASIEELVNVDEIGIKIAESVSLFFDLEENNNTIARLKGFGVQLEFSADKLANQTDKLNNLTFVVSGIFSSISRNELKKMIEDNGGKVSGSISAKTSYIVAGDKMGPSKKTKAEQLKIPIITENEFFHLII